MVDASIHVYFGDGKGKTTAAMGLALRAAGSGLRVGVAQFLKSGVSGEIKALGQLENVTILPCPKTMKFLWYMTDAEKNDCKLRTKSRFDEAKALSAQVDLLVLDELCGAVDCKMLDESQVLSFLRQIKSESNEEARPEIVITGRNPSQALLEISDYASEIQCVKHPYHRGQSARKGIEF